jgi:putative NADPH-quinone reductase
MSATVLEGEEDHAHFITSTLENWSTTTHRQQVATSGPPDQARKECRKFAADWKPLLFAADWWRWWLFGFPGFLFGFPRFLRFWVDHVLSTGKISVLDSN